MSKKFFITGVDTDIGKTFVSKGLALALKSSGLKVGYFKPFQSGAFLEQGVLKAPDVVELDKTGIKTGYSYLLKGEVSPYLALKLNNVQIDIKKVQEDIEEFSCGLDVILVEGAGGFYCPIAPNLIFADFIKILDIETIVVTTPMLGRINHTLMTIDCLQQYDINTKGIIINQMPNNPTQSELNFIEELKAFCDTPILGIIKKLNNEEEILNSFKEISLL